MAKANMAKSSVIIAIAIVLAVAMLSSFSLAAESCTLGNTNTSSCNVEDGALTLNPLETEAFLSVAEDKVCIVYFYSPSCSHCKAIKPLVDELEQRYTGNIRLTRYDVTVPDNIKLYNQLCSLQKYNGNSIPLIGINDRILVGEKEIRDNLEAEILRGIAMEDKTCPLGGDQCHMIDGNETGEGNSSAEPPVEGLKDLKFATILPIILVAGLSDGVNPCAFIILIFIMVFLQQISGSKKRVLKVSISYILSFLVTNILIGVLYYFISIKMGFPEVIRYIIIVVAIVAGLINIKDFFWYGKGISLGIPKSAKGYLMNLVHLASVPAALVLGVSVAVLEAPCSIPIYLSVIEVLKGAGRPLGAVLPYILLYNLMFVVPLIVVSIAAYKGYDAKIFEEKSLKAKRYMKLVIGIILLLLAAAFILRIF